MKAVSMSLVAEYDMSISGYFNPNLHYRKYSELNKLKFPFNLTFLEGVYVKLNSVPILLFSERLTGLNFNIGTSNTLLSGLSGSPEIITVCPVSC